MASNGRLCLITIWAKHEDGYGYADTPQFVAAFPSSLADAMYELYAERLKAACDNYRNEVDCPVVAFVEGRADIDRRLWETLHLIEDDAINPDWESQPPASTEGDEVSGPAVMQRVMHWEHESPFDPAKPEKWIAFLECNHTVEFTETDMTAAARNPQSCPELACPVCSGHSLGDQ